MNVCTHHVPNLGYAIAATFGPYTYNFAPQAHWEGKGVKPDCDIRFNMIDRSSEAGEALSFFMEFVADSELLAAMWEAYGSPTDIANKLFAGMKARARERDDLASGAVAMF